LSQMWCAYFVVVCFVLIWFLCFYENLSRIFSTSTYLQLGKSLSYLLGYLGK
jgi:hypothetical protein